MDIPLFKDWNNFGHLKFSKRVKTVARGGNLDMRELLGTSMKKIATYATNQPESQQGIIEPEFNSVYGENKR